MHTYKSASVLAKIFIWFSGALAAIIAVLYYGFTVPPANSSAYFSASLLCLFTVPLFIAWLTIGIFLLASKTLAHKNVKIITATILSILTILCIALPFVSYSAHHIAFDSVAWKNSNDIHSNDPIRKKMIRSLLGNDRLIGKTPDEIDELLGTSSNTNYDFDCDRIYYLGPESGFGVDSAWLCVHFNKGGGRVIAARIVTD